MKLFALFGCFAILSAGIVSAQEPDPTARPFRMTPNSFVLQPGEAITLSLDIEGRLRVVLPAGPPIEAADSRREFQVSNREGHTLLQGTLLPPAKKIERWLIGVNAQAPSDTLRLQLRLPEDSGLVITGVVPNLPAAKAGLKEHDIITHIGDASVGSLDDLKRVLAQGKEAPRTFHVLRDGSLLIVPIAPMAVSTSPGPASVENTSGNPRGRDAQKPAVVLNHQGVPILGELPILGHLFAQNPATKGTDLMAKEIPADPGVAADPAVTTEQELAAKIEKLNARLRRIEALLEKLQR